MPKPGDMGWRKVRIQDLLSRLWELVKTSATNWTHWLPKTTLEIRTFLVSFFSGSVCFKQPEGWGSI